MAICLKCNDIFESLENLNISIDEVAEGFTLVTSINKLCLYCNEEISIGESYFKDEKNFVEFQNKAVLAIADSLSKQIEFCSHCKGIDIESYTYKFTKVEEYGTETFFLGIDLEDFLRCHYISYSLKELVIKQLECQYCNYGREPYHPKHNPNGGHFEIKDRFYSQNDIDSFYGLDAKEFSKLAHGIELHNHELDDFKDYIFLNPLLAYRHEAGIKIFNILKKHYDKEQFTLIKKGTSLYRGRKRKIDAKEHTMEDLWNPGEGIASHGRYNSVGTSVLYCSDTESSIPYEIHTSPDDVVTIAEMFVKSDLKLLDVSALFKGFEGFINPDSLDSKILKKKY